MEDHSGCRLWHPNGARVRCRRVLLLLLLLLASSNALRLPGSLLVICWRFGIGVGGLIVRWRLRWKL